MKRNQNQVFPKGSLAALELQAEKARLLIKRRSMPENHVHLKFIKAKSDRAFFSLVVERDLVSIMDGASEEARTRLSQFIIDDIVSELELLERKRELRQGRDAV